MYQTMMHPGGEVEIQEFPERTVYPSAIWLYREPDGWKSWVNNPETENGGYWRAVSNQETIAMLDRLKAQALESQQQRKEQDEQTSGSASEVPEQRG